MKKLSLVALITWLAAAPLPAGASSGKAEPVAGAAARVVTITATDDMRFLPGTIDARSGEVLRIVLKTQSAQPKMVMAHNFVILKTGSDATAFLNASAMARNTDFIAPKLRGQILIATGLAGGGETVSVDFAAPTAPGRYPFICTFPGHHSAGMKGILVVK